MLQLLAQGILNREIAERLVISRSTAGKDVEHIYEKLGVSSRAAASVFAVQHGLLQQRLDLTWCTPGPARWPNDPGPRLKDQPNTPSTPPSTTHSLRSKLMQPGGWRTTS